MSANNRIDIEAFMERVRSAATGEFEATAQEADNELKASISTAFPPASAPGTAPHRRTGALLAGVQSIVTDNGGDIEFQQGVNREGRDPKVPAYLERGTSKMAPRPFVEPIKEQFAEKFKDATVDALREAFR